MGLHKPYEDNESFSEVNFENDPAALAHKKRVRKMLEERLEQKRLREELEDELDGEFDWGDLDH